MNIEVLYEDPAVLVVMKPVGVAAIPERDLAQPSLLRALEADRQERLFVVHRLDKEVSGVLVFARTAEAHRALSMAFERRAVDKTYVAVVRGSIALNEGIIDAPIHQFGSGRMGVDARGKASTTRFTVIARGNDMTHLEAHPVTGRRHQLRVHFYHLGHAIVGDPRYGAHAPLATHMRLMLHARRLVVPRPPGSPEGPATLCFEAPPDPLFAALVAARAAKA